MSYLNTRPLVYGFQQGMMADQLILLNDYPSRIAAKLLMDEIDIGLVPVAVIPSMPEHHIISDHCIGCNGEVCSVCLFSDVPMDKIKTILLDYQSKTSVALVRILLKEHWKINPVLINAEEGYEKLITGTTAGLVIGDRAFAQRSGSAFIFDLGTAWKEMTGLPFVFAAWVSNKEIASSFISDFNRANAFGLDHLPEVIRGIPASSINLFSYFTHNISYPLDESKKAGLNLFLKYISSNSA